MKHNIIELITFIINTFLFVLKTLCSATGNLLHGLVIIRRPPIYKRTATLVSRPTTGLNLLLLYVAAHFLVQPRQKALCCRSRPLHCTVNREEVYNYKLLGKLSGSSVNSLTIFSNFACSFFSFASSKSKSDGGCGALCR